MRRFLLSALLLLASLGSASAALCPGYPFILQNGTNADAAQVMADFNAILTCINTGAFGSITNANLTPGTYSNITGAGAGAAGSFVTSGGGGTNPWTYTAPGTGLTVVGNILNVTPPAASLLGSSGTGFYPVTLPIAPLLGSGDGVTIFGLNLGDSLHVTGNLLTAGLNGAAYTTPGAVVSLTIPATVMKFTIVGGGGGSDGAFAGGNGAIAVLWVGGLTVGSTLTVTVGAGGASGTPGLPGSPSILSSGSQLLPVPIIGGAGGGANGSAGANGTATGGSINLNQPNGSQFNPYGNGALLAGNGGGGLIIAEW